MKAITLDGLPHYVWDYEPEWGSGVQTTFRLEADQVASLTKREQRAAYSETLRVEQSATYFLSGSEAAAARNALRVLQDTPVRMPFYPALDNLGTDYGALWHMAFDYSDQLGEISTVKNPWWTRLVDGLGGRRHIVPTLVGFLVEPPKFQLANPELITVGVRWQESSEFAEALQLVDGGPFDQGPAIGMRTIYQFPFMPDFDGQQDSGAVVVEVNRQTLGFSRSSSSAAYPQLGSRQPSFQYTLDGGQAARLLQFFMARRGPTEVFWLPCWVGECRLAADAAAVDNTVTVTDSGALGDQRYLQFLSPAGDVVQRQVTGIAGNVLTLDSALGVELDAQETVLCTLALVRFDGGQLTMTWSSPDLAKCVVQFSEVTQEYATPIGEEYGQTMGNLPAKCFLFELRMGEEVFFYTSYEKDLTFGGQIYKAVPIDFEEIADGTAWDTSSCQLKMRSSWSEEVAAVGEQFIAGEGASGPILSESGGTILPQNP